MKAYLVPQDKKGWDANEILKCVKDYHRSKKGDVLITDYDFIDVELQNQDLLSSSFKAQYQIICDEKAEIKEVGEYCAFYGQLSEVIEINGTSARIKTHTTLSAHDAELINEIKGEGTVKVGDAGVMQHSFSISQLPKVIASYPSLPSCYELTPSDIRWWVENNCPSEVNLVEEDIYKDQHKFGKDFDKSVVKPKVTANCIELVKEKKDKSYPKGQYEKRIKAQGEIYMQKMKDSTPIKQQSQPSIQDCGIMSAQEWYKQNFESSIMRGEFEFCQIMDSYASYYHTTKSVVSKDVMEATKKEYPIDAISVSGIMISCSEMNEKLREAMLKGVNLANPIIADLEKRLFNASKDNAKLIGQITEAKSDSVEFADWIHFNEYDRNEGNGLWCDSPNNPEYTTQELYTIFLQQKQGT